MGYTLYIIADGSKSKIGITSRKLEKRLKEYDTHNPHWRLVETFNLSENDARAVERSIKAYFSPRKSGSGGEEWFDVPSEEMVSLVRGLIAQADRNPSIGNPIFHTIVPNIRAQKAMAELEEIISSGVDDGKDKKSKLRAIVREEFIRAFSLGISHDALYMNYKFSGKTICPPDLEHALNIDSKEVQEAIWKGQGRIDPPYSDHEEFFYHLAPLASGTFYAFCSSLVIQPYADFHSEEWKEKFSSLRAYAEQVGWHCFDHSEWSWYWPGKTALAILQPKTPISRTLSRFSTSFKKFVVESLKKYQGIGVPRLDEVIERIVYDDCFPLDIKNFESLNSDYLGKIRHLELDSRDPDDAALIQAYKYLFNEWLKQ
ncbi:MAG: hypothetical protein D6694_12705 [Gammaproteobacteria bacterium]|nr:MAG: hypothetical protein D6694_12705 [Gammaproteobacteria bacterium]